MSKKEAILTGVTVFGSLCCIMLGGMDQVTFQTTGMACALVAAFSAGTLYMSIKKEKEIQFEQRKQFSEEQTEQIRDCIMNVKDIMINIKTNTEGMSEVFAAGIESWKEDNQAVRAQIKENMEEEAGEIDKVLTNFSNRLNQFIENWNIAERENNDRQKELYIGVIRDFDNKVQNLLQKHEELINCQEEKLKNIADSVSASALESISALTASLQASGEENKKLGSQIKSDIEEELVAFDDITSEFDKQLKQFAQNWKDTQEEIKQNNVKMYSRKLSDLSECAQDLLQKQEELINKQGKSLKELSQSYANFNALTETMLSVMNKNTAEDNQMIRELMEWSKTNGK